MIINKKQNRKKTFLKSNSAAKNLSVQKRSFGCRSFKPALVDPFGLVFRECYDFFIRALFLYFLLCRSYTYVLSTKEIIFSLMMKLSYTVILYKVI